MLKFVLAESHGLDFVPQSLQHTLYKGVIGDSGPDATVLGESCWFGSFIHSFILILEIDLRSLMK